MGRAQWAVHSGRFTVGRAQWVVHSGQRTVGGAHHALLFKRLPFTVAVCLRLRTSQGHRAGSRERGESEERVFRVRTTTTTTQTILQVQ